jgi:signal transduction histidine kinase
MNLRIRFRLIALALVVALMGLFILFATFNTQQQAAELRARLSQVDLESFRIADQFRESLRELNNTLQRYGLDHSPEIWKEFLDASHKLDAWIDEQKPKLTTTPEEDALQQIDTTFDEYLGKAQELKTNLQSLGDKPASLADYNIMRATSRRLFDLGDALSKAHYESRRALLNHANHALQELHWVVIGSLSLLFAFGITLAAIVYREMIAPLRVKLVESELLIERSEKLASLGMLAAGVAHEIRNPLTAIKAALFIQQKKLQPGSVEHGDAKMVEREILRLERIVNDFLLFARPSDPQLTVVSVDLVLLETQHLMEPQLSKAGIKLVLEAAAPLRINVDSAQIQQVLINLVQNAADSMGSGGTITLGARRDRKLLAKGESDVAVLEVVDTGKGIPPSVEKRLFDPFFTTKDNGTGLGLSIAARIVQNHGGALQYQTEVNHGTTFGIVLPLATA